MANVVVTMDAREAQLFRAMDKLLQKQAEVNKRYADGSKVSTRAGEAATKSLKTQSSAVAEIGGKVSNLVKTWVTYEAGVRLVTEALRAQAELQERSLRLTKDLAKAQESAAQNLTGLSSAQKTAELENVLQVQKATGFADQAALTNALGSAYSASGGDIGIARGAVQAAAGLTVMTPEKLDDIAAGIVDVMKASGIKSSEGAAGFLLDAGANSRVVDRVNLSKNLAPAIASGVGTAFGQSPEEAARQSAAVFSALTVAVADSTGEKSRTATQQLLDKMESFFSERGGDPGTQFGRLQALQNNEQLRSEFLASPFGDASMQVPFRQLVTAGSELAKTVEQNFRSIDFGADTFQQAADEANRGLTPRMAVGIQATKAAADKQLRESSTGEAVKGLVATIVGDTLADSRLNNIIGLGSPLVDYANKVQVQSASSSAEAIRLGREALERRYQDFSNYNFTGTMSQSDLEKLEGIRQSLRRLNELAEVLGPGGSGAAIVDKFGQSVDKFGKQTDRMGRGNVNPAARAQAAGIGGG